MKDLACPACGTYNFYTRSTCYKCGASLVDGRRPDPPPPTHSYRGNSAANEGGVLLGGALVGALLFALLAFIVYFPLLDLIYGPPTGNTSEVFLALSFAFAVLAMGPGMFCGVAAASYTYRRRHHLQAAGKVNWPASGAAAVAFLVTLLVALLLVDRLPFLLLLPFITPPAALLIVLNRQQHPRTQN